MITSVHFSNTGNNDDNNDTNKDDTKSNKRMESGFPQREKQEENGAESPHKEKQ